MCRLIDDITLFLESYGFHCSRRTCRGHEVICTTSAKGGGPKIILPVEISAEDHDTAIRDSNATKECVMSIRSTEGYPLIITEDRWRSRESMMQKRLLAHLEHFCTAYARNCEIRRIEKKEAQEFLIQHHSYGYAESRYRYGMYLRRNTGTQCSVNSIAPGTLIAVATFSNARRWVKSGKDIRSYEWTRYASLPNLRISGGMGKMLKTFIEEVHPDDIMTYADLEWSEGEAYKAIGFRYEGEKEAVMFTIDTGQWSRTPVRNSISGSEASRQRMLYFRNIGSGKYRLKLTEY